jgi:hypothetical protein
MLGYVFSFVVFVLLWGFYHSARKEIMFLRMAGQPHGEGISRTL